MLREPEGGRISDETLLVLLNAHHEAQTFTLPEAGAANSFRWELLMDTEQPTPPTPTGGLHDVGGTYALAPRALALFRRVESDA